MAQGWDPGQAGALSSGRAYRPHLSFLIPEPHPVKTVDFSYFSEHFVLSPQGCGRLVCSEHVHNTGAQSPLILTGVYKGLLWLASVLCLSTCQSPLSKGSALWTGQLGHTPCLMARPRRDSFFEEEIKKGQRLVTSLPLPFIFTISFQILPVGEHKGNLNNAQSNNDYHCHGRHHQHNSLFSACEVPGVAQDLCHLLFPATP